MTTDWDFLLNLSETQKIIIILSVSVVSAIVWIARRRHTHGTSKRGAGPRSRTDSRRRQTNGRMEFYTTPGAYDIVEVRPTKYTKRQQTREKSWDKELDEWVNKRRNK